MVRLGLGLDNARLRFDRGRLRGDRAESCVRCGLGLTGDQFERDDLGHGGS